MLKKELSSSLASAAESALKFDASAYPRLYTASLAWRITGALLAALTIIPGALAVWYFGSGHEYKTVVGQIFLVGGGMAFMVLGIVLLVSIFKCQIVLMKDAIEVASGFNTVRARRSDIVSVRTLVEQGINTLEIRLIRPRIKKVKYVLYFKPDQMFERWFVGIENPDVQELQKSMQELEEDPSLGRTPAERPATLARARRLAKSLIWLTLIVTFWLLYYPRPYRLAIAVAAALPWLAIGLVRFAGVPYTFNDARRNSVKADLTMLLLSPAIVLPLRGFLDFHMLDWQSTILPALVGGAVMTSAVALVSSDLRARAGGLLMLAGFLCLYCAGVTALANGLLDTAAPTDYKVTVLAKRFTTGKGAASYLTVSAWGPFLYSTELQVSSDLYRLSYVGGSSCVELHPGRLAIPWSRVKSVENCVDRSQTRQP